MVVSSPTNAIAIPLGLGRYYFAWDPVLGAVSYSIVAITRYTTINTGNNISDSELFSVNVTTSSYWNDISINLPTDITISSVGADGSTASVTISKDAQESMNAVNFTATPYNNAIMVNLTPLSYTTIYPIIYNVNYGTGTRLSNYISTTGTNVVIPGLTNDTTYNVTVSAYYNNILIGTYVNRTGLNGLYGIKCTPTAGTIAPSISIVNTALSTFTVNGVAAYDGSIFTLSPGSASVTVVATPSDPTATKTITGDSGLSSGFNTLTVTVTSGGVTGTYTVSLYVSPASAAVCFLGDAPVLTSAGYRPIRDICVGDTVITADGRTVAVKRVFRRSYSPSHTVNPYVIPKGFLGSVRSFAISPNHEVQVPGRGMVKARDLNLRRMKMTEDFVYYNLELDDWVHDNLVVAGVEVESLAPAKRVTMTKAEFMTFVKERYTPAAANRLRSVCFEELGGNVSMPALNR